MNLILSRLHQDISPANILVSGNGGSSPYDVTFKLSDFGLTRFEENPEDTMDIEARERCGTQMYSTFRFPEQKKDTHLLQALQNAFGTTHSSSAVCSG